MSWATCIELQMHVRGRVTDPFPEDPRALEERLETERVERRGGAQDARIRARAEALAGKSYSDDAFRIRPVASASELVEESENQHNCLATYADAVAEGMTDIWLMRRANDPDRSHVTVEVRDGEVRQAFRACNQVVALPPTPVLAAGRSGAMPAVAARARGGLARGVVPRP